MQPAASPTFQTLLRSLAAPLAREPEVRVLLYDNTPPPQAPTGLPDQVDYFASPVNVGLADAYNLAVGRARDEGFDWLLTLDQDTGLPVNFIEEMVKAAEACAIRPDVAAVVPHIRSGGRDVSPNWFVGGVLPRWFPRGYYGVPDKTVYAFNSGTLVRVSAVGIIGGYSRLFWLDYCDAYLFRQMARRRWKVFVAGTIHLEHDFSMLDVSKKMSLWRYGNAVEAGSAFYDLEMSWLAGLHHTFRLLGRYVKQLVRRESSQLRHTTAFILRQRLCVPRARRVSAWIESQQRRIAANGS